MIKRVVEIANPARLRSENRQLVIERQDFPAATIPFEDLGVLIIDHPAVLYSQRVLIDCSKQNVALIVCDEKHHPSASLLPFEGNHLHTKVFRDQVAVKQPIRKRVWQSIIQSKIHAQAELLERVGEEGADIRNLTTKVVSGDSSNIEAQASRLYWRRLFGSGFKRERDQPGTNALLNYGYAIIRAAVARSVVSAGLHPAYGIKHSNQYNPFCLADDLIEPLRPLVDAKVREFREEERDFPESEPASSLELRRALLSLLGVNVTLNGAALPIIPALQLYAAGCRDALLTNDISKLAIPRF